MNGFKDYDKYDGLGLSELVRNHQVTPGELVEEAITRIERLNPQLDAVIHKAYGYARETARASLPDGPFRGIPFLLKDLYISCAGMPLTSGSRFFKDYIPDHDCELVSRYKQAGVIIIGKTNLPEFGLAPVTEPELFGPSRNPWDLTRTPGGSSGGAAAAVAAGIVPLAHASDGGGSIRMPSSCCGLFGIKPTRGRTPAGPDFGEMWRGFNVDHVITRSVRDSAAMLDATAGPDIGDPYWAPPPKRSFLREVGQNPGQLRIAFSVTTTNGIELHADCIQAVRDAAKLCSELGHVVEEAAPEIDVDMMSKAFATLWSSGSASTLKMLNASKDQVEPLTWALYEMGSSFSAPDYLLALQTVQLSEVTRPQRQSSLSRRAPRAYRHLLF